VDVEVECRAVFLDGFRGWVWIWSKVEYVRRKVLRREPKVGFRRLERRVRRFRRRKNLKRGRGRVIMCFWRRGGNF
jgi:hypothetical protein